MSRLSAATVAALIVAVASGPALCGPAANGSLVAAQYKWIGPDGSVNYGDRPPNAEVQVLKGPGTKADQTPGDATLPYALRMAAAKYPVVIYSTADCKPCQQGRGQLSQRGIPFTEKLVRSAADLEALKKLGFEDGMLPGLLVGRQRLNGFEATAWNNLLDAAGYPKNSMLPRGYAMAAAEPLTAAPVARNDGKTADAPPKRARKENPEQAAAAILQPTGNSPPGFRF